MKKLTVNELAKAAQTTTDAIRHYVHMELLSPMRDPENGYRLFREDDIKRVKFIYQAKGLGFTLRDIQIIFDHSKNSRSPCPVVREIIQKRIDENRKKLAELIELQKNMDDAIEKWKDMPDGDPDGDSICHLIESIS